MSWNFPSFSFLKNVSGIQTWIIIVWVQKIYICNHLVSLCHCQIFDFSSDAIKSQSIVIPLLPGNRKSDKMHKIFLLTDKKIVSLESIEMGMNGLLPEGYLYTKLHLHIVYLLKTSNIKINHHLGGTILRKKCALKFKSRKLPSFSVALLDITPFGLNRVLSSLMDWKMWGWFPALIQIKSIKLSWKIFFFESDSTKSKTNFKKRNPPYLIIIYFRR